MTPLQHLMFEHHHPTPMQQWLRAWASMYDAPKARRWLAKHLKIDNDHGSTWFALGVFAPMQHDGRWHIAAPEYALDHSDIAEFDGDERAVILIDPESDVATVMGRNRASIFGPVEGETITLRSSPLQWLRDWADARAIWLARYRNARTSAHVTIEQDLFPPTALLIGDPAKAPYGCIAARKVVAPPEIARIVRTGILRAASLPFVEAA